MVDLLFFAGSHIFYFRLSNRYYMVKKIIRHCRLTRATKQMNDHGYGRSDALNQASFQALECIPVDLYRKLIYSMYTGKR